jgi:hypothetical protein
MSDRDVDAYRRDTRNETQFKQDIQDGTRKEREIAEKYVKKIEEGTGILLKLVDNGCDNSGRWIKADKISTRADFILGGKPLEVKFSDPWSNLFHLKVSQIESYIRQKAYLLFVNGYNTSKPKYVLFLPHELIKLTETKSPVTYWEKPCYELFANEFRWEDF